MAELSEIVATPAAAELVQRLEAEHGALSLHVSARYGATVSCLPASELRLGARDVRMGWLGAVPLYMQSSEAGHWTGVVLVLDLAPGAAYAFSLEAPSGRHFTIRKRSRAAKTVWDANDFLAPPPTKAGR